MTETVVDETISGYNFIQNGKIPYSECIMNSLEKLNTDYVLWFQDDYFLRKTLYKDEFEKYMNFVIDEKVDRLGICKSTPLYQKDHVVDNIYKMKQNSKYTISMQASIWKTDFFQSCLIKGESPWQFEVEGTKRLNKRIHNSYLAIQDTPWYLEAMRKGKFTDEYHQILKEENIHETN